MRQTQTNPEAFDRCRWCRQAGCSFSRRLQGRQLVLKLILMTCVGIATIVMVSVGVMVVMRLANVAPGCANRVIVHRIIPSDEGFSTGEEHLHELGMNAQVRGDGDL